LHILLIERLGSGLLLAHLVDKLALHVRSHLLHIPLWVGSGFRDGRVLLNWLHLLGPLGHQNLLFLSFFFLLLLK